MTKNAPRNRDLRTKSKRFPIDADEGPIWLWGSHAVQAALANPDRKIIRLLATRNAAQRMVFPENLPVELEEVSPKDLDRMLPPGSVHQGIVLETEMIEPMTLEAAITSDMKRLVVMDQLSDPHNIGAILRSAAAFGIDGAVMQNRHTPPLKGVVAKAAVGAVESVKEIRVVNIARALNELEKRGYHVVGLAGEAPDTIDRAVKGFDRIVLVLGAEGAGLRPVVEGACTSLAHIPMRPGMESLNVSNAAAIAFYEVMKGAF